MTTRLRGLITDLVHDAGIDVIQVEGRAKTVDSFVEKIGRKGKKYDNPFTDMTDLIGLRVITYYHEDVARIGEILKGEFKELRRRLFRLSALFELADEQFSELRDARARIEAEHAADVREGHLDIPLDEASLAVYLDDSGKSDTVGKMITDTGGKLYGQDERALAKDRRDVSIHGVPRLGVQLTAGSGGSQGFPRMAVRTASSAAVPWAAAESR